MKASVRREGGSEDNESAPVVNKSGMVQGSHGPDNIPVLRPPVLCLRRVLRIISLIFIILALTRLHLRAVAEETHIVRPPTRRPTDSIHVPPTIRTPPPQQQPPPSPLPPSPDSDSSSKAATTPAAVPSSSWLVLCTTDGYMYAVDAYTGQLQPSFPVPTGTPLVGIPHDPPETAETSPRTSPPPPILPGLDGRLYVRRVSPLPSTVPPSSTTSSTTTPLHPLFGKDDIHDHVDEIPLEASTSTTAPTTTGTLTVTMEPLELTVQSLASHPVRTCQDDDNEDDDASDMDDLPQRRRHRRRRCGVLTATTTATQLIALNPWTAQIVWHQGMTNGSRENPSDATTSQRFMTTSATAHSPESRDFHHSTSTVLLQRQDYWIEQVSLTTGLPEWNLTVGIFQALDFGQDDDQDDDVDERRDEYGEILHDVDNIDKNLPPIVVDVDAGGNTVENELYRVTMDELWDDDGTSHTGTEIPRSRRQSSLPEHRNVTPPPKPMPTIAFGPDGRHLTAVDASTNTILWQTEVPSVLASVFGLQQGEWRYLQVIDEQDVVAWDDKKESDLSRHFPDLHRTRQEHHIEMLEPDKSIVRRLPSSPNLHGADDRMLRDLLLRQDNWSKQQYGGALPDNRLGNDGQLLPSGAFLPSNDCRLGRPILLALPSPSSKFDVPIATIVATTPLSQNGVMLSWATVWFLVGSLVVVVVGAIIFYHRKKEKWLVHHSVAQDAETVTLAPNVDEAMDNVGDRRRRSGSLHDDLYNATAQPRALKRSTSLPEVFDRRGESSRFRSRKNHHSDLDDSINDAESASRATTDAKHSRNANLPQQNIPFVQYSRYASEFTELEPLGSGGFGSVFRCRNVLDDREYAIKKVTIRGRPVDTSFQQRLSRVLREVKILAVLDHPHIVRYYTAWLEIDQDGITEEHSTAGSDHDVISMSRRFSSTLLTEKGDKDHCIDNMDSSWSHTFDKKPCLHYRAPSNPFSFVNNAFDLSTDQSLRRQAVTASNSPASQEDLGFIFESGVSIRSSSSSHKQNVATTNDESKKSASSHQSTMALHTSTKGTTRANSSTGDRPILYTLYIQMHLCTQQTLSDFLANQTERQCANKQINVQKALGYLLQVTQAVRHVHERGLIHRDLKPQNCFMDESGIIKVGDFGLSRESSDKDEDEPTDVDCDTLLKNENDEHTAGVGTRSYASPEQMIGSNYDSSTDVYSLGIMMFELCCPMYTTMERNICLSRLRQRREFPNEWGTAFDPLLRAPISVLVQSMVNPIPGERPTAESVVGQLESILQSASFKLQPILTPPMQSDNISGLGSYQIDSGAALSSPSDIRVVRIEAPHRNNVLQETIEQIHNATRPFPVQITQYGLRAAANGLAIMEFSLQPASRASDALLPNSSSTDSSQANEFKIGGLSEHNSLSLPTMNDTIDMVALVSHLREQPGVVDVRQLPRSWQDSHQGNPVSHE